MKAANCKRPSGQGPWPLAALIWPDGPASISLAPQSRASVSDSAGLRVRIVTTSNENGGKRQFFARIGTERRVGFHDAGKPLFRRRGDEEGAHYPGSGLTHGMDRGNGAKRMRDQNDRPRRGLNCSGDCGDPFVALRFVPIALMDSPRRRELLLPSRLPMIGARSAETRNDQKIGIRRPHYSRGQA